MNTFTEVHGVFLHANTGLWVLAAVLALLLLGYFGAPLIAWALVGAVVLTGFGAPLWLIAAYAAVMLIFLIIPLRRALISSVAMKLLAPIMPSISEMRPGAYEHARRRGRSTARSPRRSLLQLPDRRT